MLEEIESPTVAEIAKARKQTGDDRVAMAQLGVMREWKGQGWDRSQVMYGILIGLRIAQNREGER